MTDQLYHFLTNNHQFKRLFDLECKLFSDFFYIDEYCGKVVYNSPESAIKAYCEMQIKEMELFKWIESEKANRDLGKCCNNKWIAEYSSFFREYWIKTHIFIKV